MSRCLWEDWFYQAFNKPDCVIQYADSEIEISANAGLTPEQREYLKITADTLTVRMTIDTSDFRPCVVLLNQAENLRFVPDHEDHAAAHHVLETIIRERYGMGLVSYWYQQLDRNIPGYRPLNALEMSMVQKAISQGEYGKWMFRTAREALRGMDHFIDGTAADLDKMEVYDPDVLDWLNCAIDMKRKILRFGLPEVTEPNMFYGIEFSRIGFKVKYYYFRFSYAGSAAQMDSYGDTGKPLMSGYSCTMLSSKMPWLTCAEYASRWHESEEMVLDWIHRGEIRTAAKNQEGWKILSGTVSPGGAYAPQTYIPTVKRFPTEAVASYPFLSRLTPGQWFQIRETGPEAYSVAAIPAGKPDAEGLTVAVLSRREREKFEYDLLRADWVRYDMRESMMRMDNLRE